MKKKTRILIVILVCMVLIVAVSYLMMAVPFEWDILYTFEPYQSKAEIAEIIGFQSNDIKENNINEGMVHLLFVKNDKVVASILSYSSNLGYSIDFSSKENLKVAHAENAQFLITKVDGITTLTYIK